jgi:hypothetical protein
LRCTFFPRLLCASLLSPLSIAVSRAFLVLFINPGACWLWFGLVCFLPSFFYKYTASRFLLLLFSFPNLFFVFWALVVEGFF